MEQIKRLDFGGPYQFELILKSKTEYAHSLMTDSKLDIVESLDAAAETLSQNLACLVTIHQDSKR